MEKHTVTKNIEKMVDPIEAGTIHYMQQYTKMLPSHIQDRMITNGAKKNPYMGFIVQPYSFFLAYEILDIEWATSCLPNQYRLIKTKIFKGDLLEKYYAILGSFNVQTSAFFGTRMEFYVIAENTETGLLSWVIVDYDTNTISFDQNNGLTRGNTEVCIHTTNYNGEVIIDIRGKNRKLVVNAVLEQGVYTELQDRLWLEGNLSVAYGKDLERKSKDAFCVMFHPKEVEKALSIPLSDVNIESNTWFESKMKKHPEHAICFPYAQHFLADSPGHYSHIQDVDTMVERIETIDFNSFPKYSAEAIKKSMMIGQLITGILVVVLCVLYILK